MDRETRERKTRNDIRKRKEGRLKRNEEDANKSRKIKHHDFIKQLPRKAIN